MRLIITGCEYTGKTTLGEGVSRWIARTMGSSRTFHDHFTLPSPEVAGEDLERFMGMAPAFKERFQRYMIEYHLNPSFLISPDHLLTGFHIEEAVFAPLYYGYGGEGEYAERTTFARSIEKHLMDMAPDSILVLLKASPDAIAERMRRSPVVRDQRGQRPAILQEKDIEDALDRFDAEFRKSLIRKKITIDNTNSTVEETLGEFVSQVKPHLSQADHLRILANRAFQEVGEPMEGGVAHIKTRDK